MKSKKLILQPVQREDFNINFGGKAGIDSLNPLNAFEPAIMQFKKLAVGRYFWFIADAEKGIPVAAGGMLEKIVPIKLADFLNHPPEILFRNVHPEDIVRMFAFTTHWVSFITAMPPERRQYVRPTIYIRLLNPEQLYKWVMVQYAEQVMDADGKIAYGLTLVTDISHIKKEGTAMMSILDTFEDSCQLFYCTDGKAVADTNWLLPKISRREIEVLRLLAIGYSSKQIAEELKVAVKTIDNHRQNMLHKTNCKSAGELVAFGITQGYI